MRFWLILIILFFLNLSCSKQANVLKIKGSDTEVNISVLLAEAYFLQHSHTPISISGGGSGLGIASLMNGLADIANSSRPMNREEEPEWSELTEEQVKLNQPFFVNDYVATLEEVVPQGMVTSIE